VVHISGKITIIELMWVTLLQGGAVTGILIGFTHFGTLGGVIGLPVGIGGGLLLSCGIAFLLNTFLGPKRDIPYNPHDEDAD
jgi:hypothetical protein